MQSIDFRQAPDVLQQGQAGPDICFYEHRYPPDYKSYSKTKPVPIEEFNLEKKWWARPDAHADKIDQQIRDQMRFRYYSARGKPRETHTLGGGGGGSPGGLFPNPDKRPQKIVDSCQ